MLQQIVAVQGFVLFNFQIPHFVLSLLFDTRSKSFPVNEEMQTLQVPFE